MFTFTDSIIMFITRNKSTRRLSAKNDKISSINLTKFKERWKKGKEVIYKYEQLFLIHKIIYNQLEHFLYITA